MYSFWFRVILGGLIISFTQVNLKIESSLSGLAHLPRGVYHQFYPGKTDFSWYLSLVSVCLYICTGISLYIPISWLFWMGSHWWHWTAKSWLSALAVLNGGRGDNQFICTGISLYIPISWLFQMGSHWQHWTAKSWLSALAVLNGGRGLIVSLSALVFPYIFLLVDHFEWALIGNIGQWRVDSVLWQFQMGGLIISFTWVNLADFQLPDV